MAIIQRLMKDKDGYYMVVSGQCIEVNLLPNSKAKSQAEWQDRPK